MLLAESSNPIKSVRFFICNSPGMDADATVVDQVTQRHGIDQAVHRPGCIGWLAEPGPDPAQLSGMLATAIRRSAQRYH